MEVINYGKSCRKWAKIIYFSDEILKQSTVLFVFTWSFFLLTKAFISNLRLDPIIIMGLNKSTINNNNTLFFIFPYTNIKCIHTITCRPEVSISCVYTTVFYFIYTHTVHGHALLPHFSTKCFSLCGLNIFI